MCRSQFAVLIVGDLRRLRYRRALTAHPIDVVLYSGIIKRILQTVEVCSILFCGCESLQICRAAVSRLKLAVLIVGDLRRLRYRRALTAHPIDVVLYSGIIKRILQTVEVCGILFLRL